MTDYDLILMNKCRKSVPQMKERMIKLWKGADRFPESLKQLWFRFGWCCEDMDHEDWKLFEELRTMCIARSKQKHIGSPVYVPTTAEDGVNASGTFVCG